MNEQIDPTIKSLVQAIGEAETGPSSPEAYTKKGASGEYGRYQFMPDTYKNYAQKYLGDAKAAPTVENQNKIVYKFAEEKKKAGYNPAQIASMWNAGEGRPNAYKENFKGVNSQGVSYDTPAYAQKVSAAYQRLKGQTGAIGGPDAAQQGESSFIGDVGKTFSDAGSGVSNAIGNTISGKINPLSGLIQGVGSIAGGIGGLTSNILEHTPIVGSVFKGAEGLVGQGVGALAQTNAGKGVVSNYQSFAQQHPELAGDLEGAFNIATAIPVLKGLGVAKNAVTGGISTALRGGSDAVLDTVSPRLTGKAASQALMERGTVKKGLLRETQLAPDPKMQQVADTVKQYVPKFNPSKSLEYNVGEVQKVSKKMAADLKQQVLTSGADKIYPKRELISRLRKLEKPDLIASDATLNNVYDRLIKRVESLAAQKGGKVSNLLDLRQEFDSIVRRQYPNLYKNPSLSPLRQAVGDIRDSITDFTAENLPDVALRDSLLTQHRLIKAAENMAQKATSGASKEIGTNAISRFGARHPVIRGLVKSGTRAAVEGTGIGAALRIMQ